MCDGALGPARLTPRSSYATVGEYRIATCAACGTGTTWPRPTADELTACYAGTYGYGAHALIEAEKRFRSSRLVKLAPTRTGRVLDIGCMFGFLLDEAARAGLQTWGVELAVGPAQQARDRGHQITCGTLDDHLAAHPDLRFDAIFAQHVLEHVPDPAAFVAAAAGALVPGGRLIFGVPNFASRLRRIAPRSWGWYQVPVHLHHFTRDAVTRLIERAGLRVTHTTTCGGDTLFLALTTLQGLGRTVTGADGARAASRAARTTLALAGRLLRPYYRLGDDELIVVAERAR